MTKKDYILLMESYVNWIESGHILGRYKCSHCKKCVCVRVPFEDSVSPKGFWDSVRVCYKCGKPSFVVVYPSGKVRVKKLGS